MDKSVFYSVFIAYIYHTGSDAAIQCGTCLQPPNYVSGYVKLKAQSIQSEATIALNITDIPIKVDVQVKPISGNNTDYVFPGLGSSQQDDDKPGTYGGVVYKYNDTSVKLYVPNRNDNSADGTVIFTGNSNAWVGPFVQKEDEAEVRVRVWTACNFPTPDYESNWIPLKVENGSDSFRELRHNLGYIPEYVTVQAWNNDTDWYSDGIMSGMTPGNVNKNTAWGGVVYAYNDSYVRIWVPGFDTGKMFSVADGWGRGSQETWSQGLVKVRVWGHMPGDSAYKKSVLVGAHPRRTSKLGNVAGSLNIDTGLVSVTIKALSGENNGFSFPTMGAVQNTDVNDKFGGVVYSYASTGIRVWHPIIPGGGNTSLYHKGTLVYVSPYWGGSVHYQDTAFGLLEVQFWNSYTGTCPPPTTPVKATTTPFTGTTTPFTGTTTPHNTAGVFTTLHRPTPAVPLVTSTIKRTSGMATATSPAAFTLRPNTGSHVSSSAIIGPTPTSVVPRTTSKGGTRTPNPQPTKDTLTADNQTEQASGGLSPVATGLIATASILSVAGCLGGLIFGLLKKKWKRTQKVDSETEDEENGKPSSNDETSKPKDQSGDNPTTEDEPSPVENGSPPADTGTPQSATNRPQTARPE